MAEWTIWPNRNEHGSVVNAVGGDIVDEPVRVVPVDWHVDTLLAKEAQWIRQTDRALARVRELEAALRETDERLTTVLMGFSDDLDEQAIEATRDLARDALKGDEAR